MRRWAIGWLIVVALVGCGCAPKDKVAPQTAELACRFTARYRDLTVAGTLARYGAGTLSLTFSEPATLKDVTAVWDGQQVTLSLYGMSFSTDPAAIPESALGQELVAVLDTAARGEGEARTDGDTLVLEGTVSGKDYALVCDGESGVPLSLSVPALPLTAQFEYE